MKQSDFRVGNLILFKGKVQIITDFSLHCISQHPNNYERIKISEEWLVEFGFEKITGCNVIENCYHKNEYSVSFDKCGSITFWVSDEKSILIEYIHTLQNLYFALTGEELTINESNA